MSFLYHLTFTHFRMMSPLSVLIEPYILLAETSPLLVLTLPDISPLTSISPDDVAAPILINEKVNRIINPFIEKVNLDLIRVMSE